MGILRFLSGLIVGSLVGAALALWFAPQSGEETFAKGRELFERILEEGRQAAADRRAELEAQFAQAKHPTRVG